MERRLSELRSDLRGWAGYFGLAAQLKLFDKLDQCSVVSCGGPGASHSHVLLETLALPAHAEPGVNAFRRLASSGDSSREEPQGLLAYGKDHCLWCQNDERVVARAGTGEPEESLGVTCFPRLIDTTRVTADFRTGLHACSRKHHHMITNRGRHAVVAIHRGVPS